MKKRLDDMGIEAFVPMHYELEENEGGRSMRRVPAIHNLIFIHSSQDEISTLKTTCRELEPLRYMMRPTEGGRKHEIIRVPDSQMENFMRVTSVEDDSVMYLKYDSYLDKVGRRVIVTQGQFAGVEGVIKRIRNNRRVMVKIDGVAAVAIANVPSAFLMFVE